MKKTTKFISAFMAFTNELREYVLTAQGLEALEYFSQATSLNAADVCHEIGVLRRG